MIDLHCHILPGIDDGAVDISTSLAMAKASVENGVTTLACTPHILPGLYNNTGPLIRRAIEQLQQTLDSEGLPLRLVTGADNHITPDFLAGLRAGRLLSLADSRYVLVEPPHHVAPLRMEDFFFDLITGGYAPVLTHPERLTWIKSHYAIIERLARSGVWMQITAGSLTGAFGRGPRYWAERMLDEGIVHILATDAHNMDHRPPNLGEGRDYAAKRVGDDEAWHLVLTRPQGILANELPSKLPEPGASAAGPGGDNGSAALDGEQAPEMRPAVSLDRDHGVRGLSGRLWHFFRQGR